MYSKYRRSAVVIFVFYVFPVHVVQIPVPEDRPARVAPDQLGPLLDCPGKSVQLLPFPVYAVPDRQTLTMNLWIRHIWSVLFDVSLQGVHV